jgi:hypothetical protein
VAVGAGEEAEVTVMDAAIGHLLFIKRAATIEKAAD